MYIALVAELPFLGHGKGFIEILLENIGSIGRRDISLFEFCVIYECWKRNCVCDLYVDRRLIYVGFQEENNYGFVGFQKFS